MFEALGISILKEIASAFIAEAFSALQTYLDLIKRDKANQDIGQLRSEQRQAEQGHIVDDAVNSVPDVSEDDVMKRLKDHDA